MYHLLVILTLIVMAPSVAFSDSFLLAAGAGYKRPMTEIVKLYEEQKSIKIDQIYGNMGQVMMQAKAVPRVALIVGDRHFLEKESGIEFARFQTLGEGILAIAYSKKTSLTKPEDLTKPDVTKVALPDEKKAIYGKAGKEFLVNSGLYPKVENRLIFVATVPQVSAYLIAGEVEAGLLNLTDVLFIQDKLGGYLIPDKSLYSPIKIVAGVMKGFDQDKQVNDFMRFLDTNPQVKEILKKYGL